MMDIECVMPKDQIQNAKKLRSMRLKQRRQEARDNEALTQRIRENVNNQPERGDDATNFAVSKNVFAGNPCQTGN